MRIAKIVLVKITTVFVLFMGLNLASAQENEKLALEISKRCEADQNARKEWMNFMNKHGKNGLLQLSDLSSELKKSHEKLNSKVTEVDKDNTQWLKKLVQEQGWPTISQVGKEAASNAWLLIQHADADPQFQKECLDTMKKLPKDQVSQKNIAYLIDRLLVAEGKKQLYGTQFHLVEGKWKPNPIEDESKVDERRKEMNLGSMAEYTKEIEKQFNAMKK
jgi:hypothetical protein